MRNLLGYIIRYHFFLIFLLIEVLSFIFLIENNAYQKSKFLNFTQSIAGSIYKKTYNAKKYLHLKKVNKELVKENIRLINELEYTRNRINQVSDTIINIDTVSKYHYIHAQVINNSTNKRYNYITLDKGSNHGIEPEMAVISDNCVIGKINYVSKNFSTALSILNPKLMISSKLKKNNYYGSLHWDGKDSESCILSEIPFHVDIAKNDTIVTSGYSATVPGGLLIGYISDFKVSDSFYNIRVTLAQDMRRISNVFVIKNMLKDEQIQLEKLSADD